jgi:hypothetical protein
VTPDAPEQQVEWLTEQPVTIPWPDEDGPFVLGAHLARVDGKVMLVGLSITSFTATADERTPGPHGLREIDYAAVRSLKVSEIATAAKLLRALQQANPHQQASRDAVRGLLNRSEEPAPSAALERVAQLYAEALSRGGWDARRPAVYVHRRLVESGTDVTPGTVRGQIHRARSRGLIPPVNRPRP